MPTDEPILIRVSTSEARWLSTALTVFGRILDQSAMETTEGEVYRQEGLRALLSLTEQLPESVQGYYPPSSLGSPLADLWRRDMQN
jgi:hypothetical protein